jgi:hypothetical protein
MYCSAIPNISNMERERQSIDNQSITGGGTMKGDWSTKLEVSIEAEFMMSSVYANAAFGVFTGIFFSTHFLKKLLFSCREIEVIQGKGLNWSLRS